MRHEIRQKGVAEVSLAGRPFNIKAQFLDDLAAATVLDTVSTMKKPLLVMHAPLDQTVGIENATEIYVAAKHPKSFISLDSADHLLSKEADARYAADMLAAWASRFVADEQAEEQTAPQAVPTMAPFTGGAAARNVAGFPFAVELSVDGYPLIIDASKDDGGDGLGPNPTRTVEGALAACVVMTMFMYARRKKIPLENASVTVKRTPREDDHSPAQLEKKITLSGPLDEAQKARLVEIADRCPVHRMLTETVQVSSRRV